ncbi:MAG TPA: helix-turn-helix domain-containing protein [Pirellulales bacterium]|jgi:AcrR family transcriptional regulator|nr:helix-turn-helix domain-containing protein [Pirellulales bacterium]
MCPRPRETTDDAILAATHRAMSRFGPARLTLAHVAAEVGVAPATLMQRFGSKRGLLLALARQAVAATGQQYAAIRAAHPSPLAALFAVADCMAGMAPTPEALANNLAYLHIDLTDPDFHRLALEQARAARAELRAILDDAVKAGALAPCNTERLARAVGVTLGGGLLAWAIEREGTAADWLRYDLQTLLAPYRRSGKAARIRRRVIRTRNKRGD